MWGGGRPPSPYGLSANDQNSNNSLLNLKLDKKQSNYNYVKLEYNLIVYKKEWKMIYSWIKV